MCVLIKLRMLKGLKFIFYPNIPFIFVKMKVEESMFGCCFFFVSFFKPISTFREFFNVLGSIMIRIESIFSFIDIEDGCHRWKNKRGKPERLEFALGAEKIRATDRRKFTCLKSQRFFDNVSPSFSCQIL